MNGNYSGNGNTITMNTVLGGDSSATDRLVIKGNSTGTTNLVFTNIGGTGAQTVDGIEVVEVDGTSDAVFTKPAKNYLKAGAYVYHLEKVGNNWYLLSLKPGTAIIPKTTDSGTATTPTTPTTTPLPPRKWRPRRKNRRKPRRPSFLRQRTSRPTSSVLRWRATPRTSPPRTRCS